MTKLEQFIKEDFGFIETDSRFIKTIKHDSLVYDKLQDRFYWNSRGIFGDTLDYLLKIRHLSYADAKKLSKSEGSMMPSVYVDDSPKEKSTPLVSLVEVFHRLGTKNRDYWYNERGYTDETIDNFMLGFTGEWHCIPIFVDGEFKNFQLRKSNPKKISQWYRGLGVLPFNFSILRYTTWVVITESPVDAIMLRQNNIPAVSQNGGSNAWKAEWNKLFMPLDKIYVVYDNDTAGYSGSLKVAQNFGYKAKVYNFFGFPDKYDITDFFKDGNSNEILMNLLLTESVTYDKLVGKGKEYKHVYDSIRR